MCGLFWISLGFSFFGARHGIRASVRVQKKLSRRPRRLSTEKKRWKKKVENCRIAHPGGPKKKPRSESRPLAIGEPYLAAITQLSAGHLPRVVACLPPRAA